MNNGDVKYWFVMRLSSGTIQSLCEIGHSLYMVSVTSWFVVTKLWLSALMVSGHLSNSM